MDKNIKRFLLEIGDVLEEDSESIYNKLKNDLKKAHLDTSHLSHMLKIITKTFDNYHTDKYLISSQHLHYFDRHGGTIIKLHNEGLGPVKIIQHSEIKSTKNKPSVVTIREYLIRQGMWNPNLAKNSIVLIERQKSLKEIKELFEINLKCEDILHILDSKYLTIEMIQKEVRKLEFKKEMKEYVIQKISINLSASIILNTVIDKFKKKLTKNFIYTTKKELNKQV